MAGPDFPIGAGRLQLTRDFAITLPDRFNRRIEEGSMCLWKPGLTVWITPWNNDHHESAAARLGAFRAQVSPLAYDLREESRPDLLMFGYRLAEAADDQRVDAFYGFAFGPDGHLQLAIYFDREEDADVAAAIWRSIECIVPA